VELKLFIEFSAPDGARAVRRAKLDVSRDTDRKEQDYATPSNSLALIVVGFLLWLVNRFIPMAGSIKSILNGVVVVGVVLWLLNALESFILSRIRVG
jgi:hypothetical protein